MLGFRLWCWDFVSGFHFSSRIFRHQILPFHSTGQTEGSAVDELSRHAAMQSSVRMPRRIKGRASGGF